MIKLFEPFQPKIGRQINTGFLQSLWDKYVPRTSESYDRISLIYLQGISGADTKPKQQVGLLVNLVLKNIFVQMNLSQNPMLFNQSMISQSVKQMREICFRQLKRIDFQLYQSLNQYTGYLERTEKEEIRYREWAKENRVITQMHREYQVLQELSKRLKELTAVKSVQLEKKYGKILFRPLDKKEYKILSEAFLWAEKKQVEEYIRHCSEEQYVRILKYLEKEPKLYILWKDLHQPVQKEDISGSGDALDVRDSITSIQREQLIELIQLYGQKEFRRFCHQVLFSEVHMDAKYQGLLQAGILWRKDKKEIYQQFEQMKEEEVHRFWEEIPVLAEKVCHMQEELLQEGKTVLQPVQQEKRDRNCCQVCRKFFASLEKNRKKYVEEIKKYLQDTVLCTEKQDEYEIIKRVADKETLTLTTSPLMPDDIKAEAAEEQIFWNRIRQMQQTLTLYLKEQEQRIAQRERQALEKYKKIYNIDIFPEKEPVSFTQKLRSWSEALLTLAKQPSIEREEQEPHYDKDVQEKKQTGLLWQEIRISEDNTDFQRLLIQLEHYMDGSEENKETDTGVEAPDAQVIRPVQNIQGMFLPVYREEQLQNPQIQELLQHLRQIKDEERQEFIRQLADMIVIQKQLADMRIVQEPTGQESTFEGQPEETLRSAKENAMIEETSLKKYEKNKLTETSLKKYEKNKLTETFLKKYEKNKFTETFIRELKSWSEAILTLTEQGQGKTQTEVLRQQIQASKDKTDFRRLTVQLAHYIEKENESEEPTVADGSIQPVHYPERSRNISFVYREEQLQSPQIQEILQHLRQIKDEERQEFIRQLADMIVIQKHLADRSISQEEAGQESTFEGQHEETIRSIKENAMEETFLKKYEKNKLTETYIRELESWSKAILNLTEQEQGKTQTEVLRQQIQASKDKADFQRLTVQLEHYIKDEEGSREIDVNAEVMQPTHDMAGKALFVYREGQLQNPQIQELLQHLRQVKDEERQEFIRQLADMIVIQKQLADRSIIQEEAGQESTFEGQPEETLRPAKENAMIEETFLKKYEKNKLTETFIRELESWSEAILTLTEQGEGKTQTEVLRQQIQASKDKTDFQRLTAQLEYYIEKENESEEPTAADESIQPAHYPERSRNISFVYREEQLQNPQIQEILQHLRQIKDEERQEFIRQLADMIVIQKQLADRSIIQEETRQESTFEGQPEETLRPAKENAMIEETFLKKYEKNKLTETFIRELESWSEAILTLTEQGEGKTQTEVLRQQIQASRDKVDFQRLTAQLEHYIEDERESREIDDNAKVMQPAHDTAGKALFVYREEQLQNPQIQKLLQHLRQVKDEERQEFIRQLADMIIIQKQLEDGSITQKQSGKESTYEGQHEETPWSAKQNVMIQEAFLKKNEKIKFTETFIRELKSWSEAILTLTEQGEGKTQTEVLRQQIQASKDKADFQRLAAQLEHYIEDEGESREIDVNAEVIHPTHDMAGKALFVYREEQLQKQLQNPQIQELLQHFRNVKDEERQEFIRRLADMIIIQKQAGSANPIQKRTADTSIIRNHAVQGSSFTEERVEEADSEREYAQGIYRVGSEQEYIQRIHEAYPEVTHRIRQYEEQREKNRATEVHWLKTIYTDVIKTVLQSEDSEVQEQESLKLLSAYSGHTEHQDIKYVFSEETLSGRKQKSGIDAQKETMQVKSLQQQMDVRLREVEKQLQKKANEHIWTGDDVRAIAERVKRQLHEELHMERLRRGMV